MRISELSSRTGVPVATIKYYLREGLLPEGRRTSPTQADYGDAHVRRVRVLRALVDAGVSIAEARRVVTTLDDPPADPLRLLEAAHSAVTPTASAVDTTAAERLVRGLGWRPGACDPGVLAGVADALVRLEGAGFTVPDAVMSIYLESIRALARAEIDHVPTESVEAAVEYVVLGSVLVEPLLLALRRVAEQVASAERFGDVTSG